MPNILILIPSFDNKHTIVYIRFDAYAQFQIKKREECQGCKFSEYEYHGYGYYDTRSCPINMRVSKLLVLTGSRYPFLIFVFYPL